MKGNLSIIKTTKDRIKNEISFFANFDFDESLNVLSYGIILTKCDKTAKDENLFLREKLNVFDYKAPMPLQNKFIVTVSDIYPNDTWYAKSYIEYESKTIYSDVKSDIIPSKIELIKSNKFEIKLHRTSYITTVKTPPIKLDAIIFCKNPKDITFEIISSDEKIACINKNLELVAKNKGYCSFKIIAKNKNKTISSDDILVLVLSDEPIIDVTNQKGTLFANDLQSRCTQAFDIDEKTGDIYYNVNFPRDSLMIYRVTRDGKGDRMILKGYGHGDHFSIDRDENGVFIWICCDNDTAVTRMPYVGGATFNETKGKVFNKTFLVSLDNYNRILLARCNDRMYFYDLDDVINNQNDAKILAFLNYSPLGQPYQYQCTDILGRYAYTHFTVGNTAGKATSGDYLDCRVVCEDLVTGNYVYEGNILSTLGERISEAEGIQAVKNKDGTANLYCHINATESRVVIYKF